jgi:hypothetical protein
MDGQIEFRARPSKSKPAITIELRESIFARRLHIMKPAPITRAVSSHATSSPGKPMAAMALKLTVSRVTVTRANRHARATQAEENSTHRLF